MKVGFYSNLNPNADGGNSILDSLRANPKVTKLEKLSLAHLNIELSQNETIFRFKDTVVSKGNFDLIIIRGGHKDVQAGIQLANYCKKIGLKVWDNNLSIVRYMINKKTDLLNFSINNLPIPKTYMVRDTDQLHEAKLKFPVIVKAANSSQGKKVFKANSVEEIERIALDLGKDLNDLLIQDFIDYEQDIRLVVMGDEVVGSMRRIPQKGEFRANFSLGGSVEKFDAPEDMKKLAVRVAKSCELEVSGVDILIDKKGDYHVLEANRTPGLAGISKALGFNVADKLIEYIFKSQGFI